MKLTRRQLRRIILESVHKDDKDDKGCTIGATRQKDGVFERCVADANDIGQFEIDLPQECDSRGARRYYATRDFQCNGEEWGEAPNPPPPSVPEDANTGESEEYNSDEETVEVIPKAPPPKPGPAVSRRVSRIVKKIQRELGIRQTGTWDSSTQSSWEGFIDILPDDDSKLAGVKKETLQKNWPAAASKLGYSRGPRGALKFIKDQIS